MSRVLLPYTIETSVEVKSTAGPNVKVVEPVVGAAISGVNRVTSAAAKFYSTESTETAAGSPVTDAKGNIPYWIEEGAWSITVTGGEPSIAPVTYAFDALSGRGTTKIAANAVTSAAIAANAVSSAAIAAGAVGTTQLAGGGVTSAKIAGGNVGISQLNFSVLSKFEALEAGLAKIQYSTGASTVFYSGVFGVMKATHGLGKTPKFVTAVIVESGGGVFFANRPAGVRNLGSTSFEYVWQCDVDVTGGTAPALWLAVA